MTEQMQENTSDLLQTLPVAEGKKSNIKLFIAISLIAISLITAGVYAGMQIGKKQVSPNEIISEPKTPTQAVITVEPQATIVPTTNVTANWKTYISDDLKLSFKYPPEFRVSENYKKGIGLYDEGIFVDFYQAGGTPDKWLKITLSSKSGFWNVSKLQKLISMKAGETYVDNDVKTKTLKRLSDTYVNGRIGKVFEENPKNMSSPLRLIIVQNDLDYYLIEMTFSNYSVNTADEVPGAKVDYIKAFDQILSTFKFLDQKESKYTCPQNGWVDCMPILDEEKKIACSREAEEWYKTNCPDFKGFAQ